jgi:MarR family transcriptional regulator, organic hydroperoxide resistance regulator
MGSRLRVNDGSVAMSRSSAGTKNTRGVTDFPPQLSSGYLVRDAHRAFQRLLERRIAVHGVTRGQWYFLRVLWISDGLSQRALSAKVGMMEPTTVIALRSMERTGLIRRVRSTDDRRKVEVWLTAKAKRLRNGLLSAARTITAQAEEGIAARDLASFRRVIGRMTANLDRIER